MNRLACALTLLVVMILLSLPALGATIPLADWPTEGANAVTAGLQGAGLAPELGTVSMLGAGLLGLAAFPSRRSE